MNIILDTRTFKWIDDAPRKLSKRAVSYLRDPQCTLHLSIAVIWELQIKSQSGKLPLRTSLDTIVAEQLAKNPLHLLLVDVPHVYQRNNLALIHRDPFDRILAAQCLALDATLLSCDSIFQQYPIKSDW